MIGEPLHSEYDLNFRFLGFPVRIAWGFWVAALLFGYNLAVGYDRAFEDGSPGMPVLLIVWIAAMFVSILVHELGHALAMRYFQIDSHIVLYHFGGLAVPSSYAGFGSGRRRPNTGPTAQLIISLAGPLLQLALGFAVVAATIFSGYMTPFTMEIVDFFKISPIDKAIPSVPVMAMIDFFLYPSVWWAVFNLLPVLPLDGGRVVQHSISIYQRRDALYEASVVSIVVGFLVAAYAFNERQPFIAIMFAMFAISSLQNIRGGGSVF